MAGRKHGIHRVGRFLDAMPYKMPPIREGLRYAYDALLTVLTSSPRLHDIPA